VFLIRANRFLWIAAREARVYADQQAREAV
jgi:hypothetical protein